MKDNDKPDTEDHPADQDNAAELDSAAKATESTAEILSAGAPPRRRKPLITAVTIENFKGIGAPIRIDLRPITLLFGNNSAGKSTILHALCYAHELLNHRNVDAHETELGGDQIDLGGFRQFVHGREDPDRTVRLRFDLDLDVWCLRELERLSAGSSDSLMEREASPLVMVTGNPANPLRSGWVEIEIRIEAERPILASYAVGVNDALVGRIHSRHQKQLVLEFDPGHPCLKSILRMPQNMTPFEEGLLDVKTFRPIAPRPRVILPDACPSMWLSADGRDLPQVLLDTDVPSSALPDWDRTLRLHKKSWENLIETVQDRGRKTVGSNVPDYVHYDTPHFDEFHEAITVLLIDTGRSLRDELKRLRYIGPIRNLHPHDSVGSSCWADGSAAWTLLENNAGGDLLDATSDWLEKKDRFDTGYALRNRSTVVVPSDTQPVNLIQEYREIREEFGDKKTGAVDLDAWIYENTKKSLELEKREILDMLVERRPFDKMSFRHVRDYCLTPETKEETKYRSMVPFYQFLLGDNLNSEKFFQDIAAQVKASDDEFIGVTNTYFGINFEGEVHRGAVYELVKRLRQKYQHVSELVAKVENRDFTQMEIDQLVEAITANSAQSNLELVTPKTGLSVRTSDVGVGVSQILPVVVAALDPDHPGITAIEQPELHVHPKMQVELGDLFAQRIDQGGIFLIETHSEHLLLRIMRRMRQTSDGTLPDGAPKLRPDDVAVFLVEPDAAGALIREMPLNERGDLVKAWPGGFFEEDMREIFDVREST